MKKFILRVTAVLLAVTALLYAGGLFYRQTNTWKNLERNEETDKYRDVPEHITFAVVGSSHGRDAFQRADYGEGFFNFSMSAQTPQYDLMQLRQFSDRIDPGATVILTVGYSSPFWTDTEQAFSDKQERYYRIFGPENIVDCDLGHWALGRFSPLLVTDAADVMNGFFNAPELREESDTLYGYQTLKAEDLESERERIACGHVGVIKPAMPDGNPVMLAAYADMIALCREKGWKPVMVTVPYPQVYTDCFSEESLEAFRALTQKISAENGVPWLDYSQDADFTENFDYFKNIDHFNIAGAKQFAEIIKPDLAELGLWQE